MLQLKNLSDKRIVKQADDVDFNATLDVAKDYSLPGTGGAIVDGRAPRSTRRNRGRLRRDYACLVTSTCCRPTE